MTDGGSNSRIPARVVRAARTLVQLGLSVGILVLGAWGYRLLGARTPPPERKSERSSASAVSVVRALGYDGALEVEVGGVVRPAREVRLASEVGGRIAHRAEGCLSGDTVDGGTVLFRLDRADYELAAREAELALEQARLAVAEGDVETSNLGKMAVLAAKDLELAVKEHARVRELKQRSVVSDAAVEQAETREIAARMAWTTQDHAREMAERRRARAAVALEIASEHTKRAALDLARTEIRAPVSADGALPGRWRVVRRAVEQGDLVARGQELVVLDDAAKVEVHCALAPDELELVWQASARDALTAPSNGPASSLEDARARPPARVLSGGRTHEGTLARIDGRGVDERTRLVPCIVEVEPVDAGSQVPLVRGTYVRVALAARPAPGLLAIPARAVRPGGATWKVEGGTLRVVAVNVVRRAGDIVLVRAGELVAGDELVASPLEHAADGMQVEVTR